MTKQLKLGIFLIGGLLVCGVLILTIGEIKFQRGYRLHIYFNNIAGLPIKAPVKISGVEVGRVDDITLEESKAKVTVWIKHKIKIHRNTKATIVTTGVIGTKYLEMTLGSLELPILQDGDRITGIDPVTFDEVIQRAINGFENFIKSVESFTKEGELAENISDFFHSAKEASDSLNEIITGKKTSLKNTIEQINKFSENASSITLTLNSVITQRQEDISEIIKNLKDLTKKLSDTTEKISKIASKIEKGEGTVGALLSDEKVKTDVEETITSIKLASKHAENVFKRITIIDTYWNFQLRYDSEIKTSHPDFGIYIKPRPGKFYYLGGTNLKETTSTDIETTNAISVFIGKETQKAYIYGGIIRSKGGFGFGLKPLKNFDLYSEVFDFARKNPPQIITGVKYRILPWLYVGTQLEDLRDKKNLNTYFNLYLRDEDIAYILGLITLAPR